MLEGRLQSCLPCGGPCSPLEGPYSPYGVHIHPGGSVFTLWGQCEILTIFLIDKTKIISSFLFSSYLWFFFHLSKLSIASFCLLKWVVLSNYNCFFFINYFNKNVFHYAFFFSVTNLSVPEWNIHLNKTTQSFKAHIGNLFFLYFFIFWQFSHGP